MVIVQRIIRSKDTKVARQVGGVRSVPTIADAIAFAKRSRKVYVYVDKDGNQGTIRSGRKMRTCDSHVRNTLAAFPVQLALF